MDCTINKLDISWTHGRKKEKKKTEIEVEEERKWKGDGEFYQIEIYLQY